MISIKSLARIVVDYKNKQIDLIPTLFSFLCSSSSATLDTINEAQRDDRSKVHLQDIRDTSNATWAAPLGEALPALRASPPLLREPSSSPNPVARPSSPVVLVLSTSCSRMMMFFTILMFFLLLLSLCLSPSSPPPSSPPRNPPCSSAAPHPPTWI